MSKLEAIISDIKTVDNLSHVSFLVGEQKIEMVSLELKQTLEVGSKVYLCIKSTSIAIAKNLAGEISCVNQLQVKISDVDNGKIVSSIGLNLEGFALESIIMLGASLRMNLTQGDEVMILVNGSEISICG